MIFEAQEPNFSGWKMSNENLGSLFLFFCLARAAADDGLLFDILSWVLFLENHLEMIGNHIIATVFTHFTINHK